MTSDIRCEPNTAPIRCRLLRIPLGLLFAYSASIKFWQWPQFAQQVGEFGIVWDATVKPVAIAVCCIELICGIGLLINTRWSFPATLGLLLVFIAVLIYGIAIGLDIECGCFGAGYSLSLGKQLMIDFAIVAWTLFTFWNCSHAD